MSISFPYTYVACPCGDPLDNPATTAHARRVSNQPIPKEEDEEEDDEPVNPHSPRSNFSLFPYDQLLFCDECQQIRCPRCWTEEISHWYCPSCLFEVPGSVVKTDGNRCMRNCYNCPVCTSPLLINSLDQQPSDGATPAGPFFLSCPSCEWSSLDAGIELTKPNKITEQLHHLRNPQVAQSDDDRNDSAQPPPEVDGEEPLDSAFARLVKFYDTQLSESDAASSNMFGIDSSYSSPANLARIMQLYGGLSATALKKAREKPRPMREAHDPSEGLSVLPTSIDDATTARMRTAKPSDLTTFEQRSLHPWNSHARFVSDLWPVPAQLMTRKSKRCRTCRLILIRLDDRKTAGSSAGSGSSTVATNIKYKIRLLAQNNIPRLSLRPFSPSSTSRDHARPSFALTTAALDSIQSSTKETFTLRPGETKQFLLVVSNPLFETSHITLATPATTPGPVSARITVLCPSFALGPDGDMWDSALDASSTASSRGARSANLAGGPGQSPDDPAEAGKVWSRGRNWASVVLEVGLPVSTTPITAEEPPAGEEYDEYVTRLRRERAARAVRLDRLEIPVFVRADWEADVVAGEDKGGAAREKREVAFWCVLGGITVAQ